MVAKGAARQGNYWDTNDYITLKVSRFTHPDSSAVTDKYEISGAPAFIIEEVDVLLVDPMTARILIERSRPYAEPANADVNE